MNLKTLRNQVNKSQEEVARELDVTLKTYWRWEKGIGKIPSNVIPKLAELYSVSESEVLRAVTAS